MRQDKVTEDLSELQSHIRDLLILAHRIEAKTESIKDSMSAIKAGQEEDAGGNTQVG